MARRVLFALLLILVLAPRPAMAAGDPFDGLSGELRVVGGEVGLAAFQELAQQIMKAHPQVKITFTLNGPGLGLAWVRLRQGDICLYDRDPGLAQVKGEPLSFVDYGVDPVAVVLNPANTTPGLTIAQVSALFTGKIRDWKDAGGPDMPALPMYIQVSEDQGKPETRPGTVSVSSEPAMRFIMVRNRETVGIASLRDVDASLKPVVLDGVEPSMKAFTEGRYRLYRVMHAAVRQVHDPLTSAFLATLTGPEGQAALERVGYLPLSRKPSWESALPVDNPDLMVKQDK